MSIPKELSIGEETFAFQCRAYKLDPVRELRFAPGRKFAFDFCWPDEMIALEIDGGNFTGGHSRGNAYVEFCRKINLANLLGWTVYRATTAMIASGEAIDIILQVLGR